MNAWLYVRGMRNALLHWLLWAIEYENGFNTGGKEVEGLVVEIPDNVVHPGHPFAVYVLLPQVLVGSGDRSLELKDSEWCIDCHTEGSLLLSEAFGREGRQRNVSAVCRLVDALP